MPDQNVRINVSATNQSGKTFDEIRRDLNRVRAELAKPAPFGPLTRDESRIRGVLQGRERGLAKQLDAARLSDLVNQRLGGAGVLDYAMPDEEGPGLFKQLKGARSSLIGITKAAGAATAAIKGIEVASNAVDLVTANIVGNYDDQVKAASAAKETIGGIPFIGEKILKIGEKINHLTLDKITHEEHYVEELKKATAEQDKQIERMKKLGEQRVKDNEKARSTSERVGADDLLGTDSAKLRAKIEKDKSDLAKALAPLRDKQGNLTETGKEIKAEGDRRIFNAQILLERALNEERIKGGQDALKIEQDSAERIRAAKQDARQIDLKLAGDSLQAQFDLIKTSTDKELAQIDRRFAAETLGLPNTDDPRYQAALKRWEDEVAAVGERAAARSRDAWVDEAKRGVDEFMRDVEEGAKQVAAEQRDAARFQVKGPSPFSGESRLLQGVGIDPVLEPTRKTAKSSAETAGFTKQTVDKLTELVAAIRNGNVVIAGPV